MDKSKQIWSRYNEDKKQLKIDCVDVVGMSYALLGQKPSKEQIKLMAEQLFEMVTRNPKYSTLTMDDVVAIFKKGLFGDYNNKEAESSSVFLNVRTMNIWLKEGKREVAAKVIEQNRLKEKQYIESGKMIGNTIKKALEIGHNDK